VKFHNLSEDCFNGKKDGTILLLLVSVNLIIKVIPASLLELGNDEVYYWTYALFPDWSHFDHPPIVGLLIRLFSFNLTLQSELFIRAGALILSSANIVILFYLVRRLYSRKSAFFAVVMYISSIYFNIITGLFILPDSPQIFFVLLALFTLLPSITIRNTSIKDNLNIVFFGFFTGLAFLSKYHSLFLWFGAGMYILFHNRIWLKKPALYVSILVTIILMFPVIYWNIKNNFISFTFHENRIGLFHSPVNLITFLRFNLGQFLYQNPVLSVIYILTLVKIFRKRKDEISQIDLLLLYTGIPLIIMFTILSLFRSTLPHWSGPAFICLIILAGKYLASVYDKKSKIVLRSLSAATGIFIITLIAGFVQINFGIIGKKNNDSALQMGKNDFTLDMYGWKQAKEKFEEFLTKEGIYEPDYPKIAIATDKWFPAAHIDYYIAYPLNIRLFAFGGVERIHKYYWIHKERKLNKADRIFYLTDSRDFYSPVEFARCFNDIIPMDTLTIDRNHKTVKYIFIYDMIDFECDTILNSLHPAF
jgi:hypothetical protein